MTVYSVYVSLLNPPPDSRPAANGSWDLVTQLSYTTDPRRCIGEERRSIWKNLWQTSLAEHKLHAEVDFSARRVDVRSQSNKAKLTNAHATAKISPPSIGWDPL